MYNNINNTLHMFWPMAFFFNCNLALLLQFVSSQHNILRQEWDFLKVEDQLEGGLAVKYSERNI